MGQDRKARGLIQDTTQAGKVAIAAKDWNTAIQSLASAALRDTPTLTGGGDVGQAGPVQPGSSCLCAPESGVASPGRDRALGFDFPTPGPFEREHKLPFRV